MDKVLEVKWISERMMVLRVRVGKSALNLVSVYAPQVGTTMEKEDFFRSLGEVLSVMDVKEQLVVCGDMHGHVGLKRMALRGYMEGMDMV